MKKYNLLSTTVKWVLVLALVYVQPAQARLVDSADNTSYSFQGEVIKTLREIKKEAKVVVNRWSQYLKQKVAEYSGDKTSSTSQASTEPAPTSAPTPAHQVPTSSSAPAVATSPAAVAPSAQPQLQQLSAQSAVGQTTPAVTGVSQMQPTVAVKAPVAVPSLGFGAEHKAPPITVTPVQVKNVLSIASPGRVGTTKMPKTARGVPTIKNLKSIKKVAKLDIGTERSIQSHELMGLNEVLKFKPLTKPSALESPQLVSNKEVLKWKSKKLPLVTKAKSPVRDGMQLGRIVTQKKIEDVPLAMDSTKELTELKPFQVISDEEMNMILALSLFNKGDKCHLASGLLTQLSSTQRFAEEANFYLGVCAHQMGFHSEAVSRLLKVVEKESPEFVKTAVTNLVEDLPSEYDVQVAAAIRNLKNPASIEEKARDNVNFVLARAAHSQDRYSEAAAAAIKVTEKSSKYRDARYMYGIALYAMKKEKEAEQSLLALRDWMVKKNQGDKNIEALIAVNLARIRFMQNRYQAAYDEYMRVPKDNSLWVQALVEQGWTQLSIDDPAGAIGNMYSLHSPYFKAVFMPESWVIRTIGYIDICQYGDAYRTLSKLEQLYGGWANSVQQYMKTTKSPEQYYATVKTYVKGKSDQSVNGLPYQVIREIARQKGFLNAQGAINGLEDEIQQYKHIYKMVKADQTENEVKLKNAKARLIQLRSNIKKAQKNIEMAKLVPEWTSQSQREEQLIGTYTYMKAVYENARKGFLKMSSSAFARIDGEKAKLRTVAGKELGFHLRDVQKRITQILEGNEFLRYEIFAGSGENIRYQVSGGATADAKRVPSNVKPEKIVNWEFDGEYWEDEIGSYRSTLKNNCPKSSRASISNNEGELRKTASKE